MKLLIVEDDSKQMQRYTDSIDGFNERESVTIEPVFKGDLASGLAALGCDDYDGAIVDLRLSSSDAAEGNRIIREIRQRKRFPVCVLTGYPNDLDEDLHDEMQKKPNLFFWLEKRDRGVSEVLVRLATIYSSGVLRIVGSDGIIEQALTVVFWTHLAKTLSFWSKQAEPGPKRQARLLRFVLTHLLQKLEVGESGDLDDYYPDEMYIIPPMREEWQTGDIAVRKRDDTKFVVLTPACDLAQSKAKNIQIVQIEHFGEGIMASLVGAWRSSKQKVDSDNTSADETVAFEAASAELMRIMGNGYSARYHFLPPCQTFAGGLINFQKINSYTFKEFGSEFVKEGTLAPSFVKDVVARFATYYARQGQPSFENEQILPELVKKK
jgi:hypothetical protein